MTAPLIMKTVSPKAIFLYYYVIPRAPAQVVFLYKITKQAII